MRDARRLRRLAGIALGAAAVAALAEVTEPGATYVPGPAMNDARMAHTGLVLADGRFAVFGGHGTNFVSLNTAETLAPGANAWTALRMGTPHDGGAVVRLADGRVLIAGGAMDLGVAPGYSAAEIYDPTDDTFRPTGSLNVARCACNGARLASGKVLVVGGWYSTASASNGEVFDPASGSFALTQTLTTPGANQVVVACDDGTALVFGGYPTYGGGVFESVSLYDPATNAFSAVRDTLFEGETGWRPSTGSEYASTTESQILPDGRSLFLASRAIDSTKSEWRLFTIDPATKQFAAFATSPALPTSDVMGIGVPYVDRANGKAYLPAYKPNTDPAEVALFTVRLSDGALTVPTGTFTMPAADYPWYAAGAVLPGGNLLVTGGFSQTGYQTNFSPIANTWYVTPTGVAPPPPASSPQFLLPKTVACTINAKKPAKSSMTVTGTLDTGADAVSWNGAPTFTVGDRPYQLGALTQDKKGVWRAGDATTSLAVTPSKIGSSRCTFTFKTTGESVASVDPNGALLLRLECGPVDASGACALKKGKFGGQLPGKTFALVSAKAALLGAGRDSYSVQIAIGTDPQGSMATDVTIEFGANYSKTIPFASIKRKGLVYSFTDKTNALPTMTVDFKKGLVTVSHKKCTLGDFPQGAQSVRLGAGSPGAVFHVDVRMARSGNTLAY